MASMENIFQTKKVKSESVENLEYFLPNGVSDQIRLELETQPLRIVDGYASPQQPNDFRTGSKFGLNNVKSERPQLKLPRIPEINTTLKHDLSAFPEAHVLQTGAGGIFRSSRPSHFSQTSTGLGTADGVFRYSLPTEKDIKEMLSIQCQRRSKKSMNAFLVWVWIQQKVLKKVCSSRGVANVYVQLGCEWSKLTEEQKKPFFEASYKLKKSYEDQFPDYQDFPKRKKRTKFNLRQKPDQLSEQQQSSNVPTFVSQAPPVTQPVLLGTFMNRSPMVLYHSMGYPLFFHPCHPVTLGSMDQNHYSRSLFACNSMRGVQNFSYSHLQSEVINLSAASEGNML